MNVLIGCDVDPVMPPRLQRPLGPRIWEVLERIPSLVEALGDDAVPITWLIRADASVRFATGDYASGYLVRRDIWSNLQRRGHELGWHMHALSPVSAAGTVEFDPRPDWLPEAHAALARHFPVRATRTGWDYGSDFLFDALNRLGVDVDFSALPGNKGWYRVGERTVVVDWIGSPLTPYHPSRADYRRPGPEPLRLLEVPVSQFANTPAGMVKRLAWRLRHGSASWAGLTRKTKRLTEPWDEPPPARADMLAFYFHPEELTSEGIRNAVHNVARLRAAGATFLTASDFRRSWAARQATAPDGASVAPPPR